MSDLRRQIEGFYLPRQLVEAILDVGGIPRESQEVDVGIGFIDIANYTYLSRFLTPKENQQILNGLYTAFNSVLRRHGGFLNKIEGDSLMFHFGGIIDARARTAETADDARHYIARELFYTCIEMQRVAVRFNSADSRFLDDAASEADRVALERAFAIIARIRGDAEVAGSLARIFQIRIRVGANLGEVTIGNFGPDGARQWDVIGMPVIDAKRMETTAPVGGFRISHSYYALLESIGIVKEYHERFRREADALGSRYRTITREELFHVKRVILKEKKGAAFETVSVQVDPMLPEHVTRDVEDLLDYDRFGAERTIELLRYYRGNRYVIDAVEELFNRLGVFVRRADLFELLYPRRYRQWLAEADNDRGLVEARLADEMSLYEIMESLGRYQDAVHTGGAGGGETRPFAAYDRYFSEALRDHVDRYEKDKLEIAHREYFYGVVYPLVFESLLASILEYQADRDELEILAQDD